MNIEILTSDQIAFLKAMGSTPNLANTFYLTGGTPLAAFYLGHRYSEDLDFFSEQEVDATGIRVFLEQHKEALGIKSIDLQQSFNRNLFFVELPGGVLKTEFTYFPFPRIEKNLKKEYGVEVHSPLDIAVNKVHTIYSRTKARDYIDLYLLCKTYSYSILELTKMARIKFDTHIDPIQLGTQFTRAAEAEDYPRMITELTPETWQLFFKSEAERLLQEQIFDQNGKGE